MASHKKAGSLLPAGIGDFDEGSKSVSSSLLQQAILGDGTIATGYEICFGENVDAIAGSFLGQIGIL